MSRCRLRGRAARRSTRRPLHAELRGLPPVFLQVGSLEILLDQDRELHHRLLEADVRVEYREPELLFHTFQSLGSQVPRADAAVREAEVWIADRLQATTAASP